MVVDEARQQVAQLQEEALARDVGVGIHVEGRGEAIVEVAEQSHLGVVERRGRGDGDGLAPRGEHRPAVGATLRDVERFARTKAQQHGLVVEAASRPLRKPEARLGHGIGRGGRRGRHVAHGVRLGGAARGRSTNLSRARSIFLLQSRPRVCLRDHSRSRPVVRLRDHSRGRLRGPLSLRGRIFLVVEVAVLQAHEAHLRVVVGRLQPMGAVAVGPRGEAAPGDDPWVQPSLLEEKLAGAVAEPRALEEACVAGGVEGFVSFLPGPRAREGQRVDPHASVQPSAGLGEGHPQPPHHEVDRAAPCPAGEATEGVAARVERQARAMVVVEGAEALVALDVEPHPLRHLLYGQVAEPLEGQLVEHGRRFLREAGMPVRYSCVLV